MTGPIINSIRANAAREMLGLQKHVKGLSQEMASGKRNVTSISSLGLIQRNLLQTQGNILDVAVAAATTHRTNITLAINAFNAALDLTQNALSLANTAALDPTANYTQIGAEYLALCATAAGGFINKIFTTTKDVNGTAIFGAAIAAQVSPVALDTITITPSGVAGDVMPTLRLLNANVGLAAIVDAATGAAEAAKIQNISSAITAEIARLNDFLTMLDSKVGQMGEQSDYTLDALAPIVDTDLPSASSQLNADITKASMIGAVLNADASLTDAVNNAAMRILNKA